MSLFERIQNKRYDLQEGVDDKKNITPNPGDAAKEKSIVRNYNKKQRNINKKNVTSSSRVKATSDILKTGSSDASKTQKDFAKKFSPKNLNKTLSQTTSDPNKSTMISGKSDETVIRTTKATGDEGSFRRNAKRKITGDVIPKKDLPKPNVVKQSEVSQKAQEFTKKINKKRVKKLPPIDLKKPTQRVDLRTIKKNVSRKRPSNAPSLADINKKIDAANPVEMGKTGPKPVRGTVLKVDQGEFKRVRKTKVSAPGGINPEAKKIMSKQVSADELLGNKKKINKKIVNNTKNTTKPSLWSRAKDKLKGLHNWMKSDFRTTSKAAEYGKNITKNTYKNTLRGNTIRNINKVLPGKYKVLAGVALGAYALTRGKKKDGGAGGADGGPKKYYGANPKLKLDMKGSPPPPKAKESKK